MKPKHYGLAAIAAAVVVILAAYVFASEGQPRRTVPHIETAPTLGNVTIVASSTVGDIDSNVVFSPPLARVVMGVNNTAIWINQHDNSVILESRGGLFEDITIEPNESFSFTFDRTGMHQYYEKNTGERGIVLVSTEEHEATRVASAPGSILEKDYEEIARTVVKAADPADDISSVRLNNTQTVAYTTKDGGDIMIRKHLCAVCHPSSYQPIFYKSPLGKPILDPSSTADMDVLMNFTKSVMDEIGYTMDGSEWIDAVDFGSRAEISIRQTVNGGWILPFHGARFSFLEEWTWIELTRWYENESIAGYEFGLSSNEAQQVAVDFMNKEVNMHSLLSVYRYEYSDIQDARVEIIDDKVMYTVPVGYHTTNPEYFDDKDHCHSPALQSFQVLVNASTGEAFDWRYSPCM